MTGSPPATEVETTCPKAMRFGPCGGVRPDGGCEVDGRACPFLGAPVPSLDAPSPPVAPRPPAVRHLVDFRPPPTWSAALDARVAERYRAAGDGVALLIGEHVDDPEHRPIPADVRQLIDRFGLPLVVTVTGRDRTADDAARIFDELAPLGVAAVHCVTGDHPAARFGPGRRATFGADSVALTELAADRGLPVTVAESPASPPAAARPGRVLTKQRAGAGAVVLNHAGGAEALRRFARRCVAVGATTPLIAPVPLITDADSARRLARFPGLHLDPDLVDAALAASEPEVEGRRRAVDLARALLRPPDGQPSFAGVNLSGTGPTDPVERAELVAGILDDVAGGDLA